MGRVDLPTGVRQVVLCMDNDSSDRKGIERMQAAAHRHYRGAGRT